MIAKIKSTLKNRICLGTMTYGSFCDEELSHKQIDEYVKLGELS